jgi:hypothetical protein
MEKGLIVPRDFFLPLVPLLGFDGHRRDRPRLQTPQRDRLARHFAVAIFAIVDPAQGRIDLGNQLALRVRSSMDQSVSLDARSLRSGSRSGSF